MRTGRVQRWLLIPCPGHSGPPRGWHPHYPPRPPVPASRRAAGTRDGDRDLVPVPVFHSRVAGDAEDGDVLLELVDLDLHVLRQAPGRRHIGEGLGFVEWSGLFPLRGPQGQLMGREGSMSSLRGGQHL